MSDKTKSFKVKEVTDEEVREYLLQLQTHLNEKERLELEKLRTSKSLNAQIKNEEDHIEKIRNILNDGIVVTGHNFMDKDTKEIVWKDDDGKELGRTPFDETDWVIYNNQHEPKQKAFDFNQEEPEGENTPDTLPEDFVEDVHGETPGPQAAPWEKEGDQG